MNIKKSSLLLLSLILLSFIATCLVYPKLPAEVAIHFNFEGIADNFAGKWIVFVLALLPLFFLGLFFIIPKLDPRQEAYQKHHQVYTIVIFSTTLLFIIIHWITLFIALGVAIPVEHIMPILVGILFIIIGNFLPRVRSNYTLGIRTPWALEDANNWKKTQRAGGYCFILAGSLIILESLFLRPLTFLFWLSLVIAIVVPYMTSYLDYRKKHVSYKK